MSQRAPAAVLFDLDGTLVHSEPVNVESVVLAVRRWGGELDAEDRQFVVGHSWNEIHQRLVGRLGLPVDMDTLILAAVEEKRALIKDSGLPELPGAVEAVRRLGSRSPLAVVSGASRVEVEEAIDGLGLRSHFAFLLGAEDYQRGKPDPEPYRRAIERLGVPGQRLCGDRGRQPRASGRPGRPGPGWWRSGRATSPATTSPWPTSSSIPWTRSPTTSAPDWSCPSRFRAKIGGCSSTCRLKSRSTRWGLGTVCRTSRA